MTEFDVILIDDDAAGHAVTQRIVALYPHADARPSRQRDALDAPAKKVLRLARHKGAFLKAWRTAPGATAPDRFYLVQAVGCPWDCTYCFLQSYHREITPRYHVNLDDLRAELRDAVPATRAVTIHAGELTDALFLDRATELSALLHDLAQARPRATVELRTKSDDVDGLVRLPPLANFAPAWTVSPPAISQAYERGAPSFEARLAAVQRVVAAGHRVGLRLDPVIRAAHWQDAYDDLIARLAKALAPEAISGIVTGLLRFSPALPECVRARGKSRRLFLDEFVRSDDGKMRYLKFLRVEMYAFLLDRLAAAFPNVRVEVASETPALHALLARRLGREVPYEGCAA